ncbi:MAG: hypothetical protein QM788_15050 [Roseateles sp.]|uniref:hypothetical protein n=1 Tax=Roseateles sp. TaxID=1971397 RepID=UPI0039E89890
MKHSITTLAAAAALALALPAQALTVTGSAAPATTTVGGEALVTLTLNVSEAFMPTSLTFNLSWADAGLALKPEISTALGLSWAAVADGLDPDWTEINSGTGHLGVSSIGVLPGLSAGVHTVQIGFTGLAVGTHAISYTLDLGAPDFGPDLTVAGSSSVTVSAVPEASPALMLAAGLAVMGLRARRRRA